MPRRSFERRHNSITPAEMNEMLDVVGFKSLDALIDATVPANIRREVSATAAHVPPLLRAGVADTRAARGRSP